MQDTFSHNGPTYCEMTRIKHRRTASTGGNRSWSEDEENYLLQNRVQKLPYKHIAAHLKKTELACRLHFYQLSHANNRRKRNSSVSSISSLSQSSNNSAQNSLPSDSDSASHGSPELQGLRLNTSEDVIRPPQAIDQERLSAIYEIRRGQIWDQIALDYGNNVSAAQLEQVWLQGFGVSVNVGVGNGGMTRPASYHRHSASATESAAPQMFCAPDHLRALSAPGDRMPPLLPMPAQQSVVPAEFDPQHHHQRRRTSTWSGTSNVSIASLLTEDKDPRGGDVSMRD